MLKLSYLLAYAVYLVLYLDLRARKSKYCHLYSEAATRGVLCKKLVLEISQNSQENACARVSYLIKLQACNFIK